MFWLPLLAFAFGSLLVTAVTYALTTKSVGLDERLRDVLGRQPTAAENDASSDQIVAFLKRMGERLPKNPKDLSKIHKTTGKKNVEMYELTAEAIGFAAAALDESEPGTLCPFNGKYAREKLPEPLAASYEKEPWRRIDNDWLFSASRLVGITPDGGKVLWEYPWTTQYGVNASQPLVLDERRVFVSTGYGTGAAAIELTGKGDRMSVTEQWRTNRMNEALVALDLEEYNRLERVMVSNFKLGKTTPQALFSLGSVGVMLSVAQRAGDVRKLRFTYGMPEGMTPEVWWAAGKR